MPLVPSSYLFLVVRPGAPSSVLAPSSDARCSYRCMFDVVASFPCPYLLGGIVL